MQTNRTQKYKKSDRRRKEKINSIQTTNLQSNQFFCYDHCKRPPVDTDEKHRGYLFLVKKYFFLFFTLIALILMNYFHLSLVTPILVNEISINVIIISQVLFLMNLLYLIAAAFTDPGIFPRATEAEAKAIQHDLGKYRISELIILKMNKQTDRKLLIN